MQHVPTYLSAGFLLTTLLAIFLFYNAGANSKKATALLIAWLAVQSVISLSGFYTVTDTWPPRFLLILIPPLLLIVLLFSTRNGRLFIDGLDIKKLTLLHIVRVPVELVLLGLFIYKTVPQLMTFEGRNFDILAGITAPPVYYYGFVKGRLSTTVRLYWNIACLALLLNIVLNAILSAPFKFQQFGFDQPNIAIFYFPFTLLPGCVVPLVLFAHLVTIRKLIQQRRRNKPVDAIA